MTQVPPAGLFFDTIEKSFGGTHALKGVSLALGRGEIVALLGENGAGKSTLIKILGDIHQADTGSVLIDGTPFSHKPGRINERQSVAFIHQDLGLIEWMTIAWALAVDCDFLVLDEPTASLPADEVERLFTTLRSLRDKGVGMIFVSHRLDEVFRIADRVAVRDVAHTDAEELVNLIVGRKTRAVEEIERLGGTVLEYVDTPIADTSSR